MKYFVNVDSLAGLKRQYRNLALLNHPDKGGDTTVMQSINGEFEKLYDLWKDVRETDLSGYGGDFADATAKEYESHVYNEYRYRGKNYEGQSPKEVVVILRGWLKETYPRYKFSVTVHHYSSIMICLMSADFDVFKPESRHKGSKSLNHYHLREDKDMTDRAKEVMMNVEDFVNSYNFDDSDIMTDYHHKNFYLSLYIGGREKLYKKEIPKITSKDKAPVFRHPEGEAHKRVRKALGKYSFGVYERHYYKTKEVREKRTNVVLGRKTEHDDGEGFTPLFYGAQTTMDKTMDKLRQAGITCSKTGSMIEFNGYDEETYAMMSRECEEYVEAYTLWQKKLSLSEK